MGAAWDGMVVGGRDGTAGQRDTSSEGGRDYPDKYQRIEVLTFNKRKLHSMDCEDDGDVTFLLLRSWTARMMGMSLSPEVY